MDPVFKVPVSPGTPLFPVSPERTNRQALPQSPSLPNGFSTRGLSDTFGSPGRISDVQGKVAQFNNLSRETTQKRKDNEAALKRAVLGREEAEGELRKLREENYDLGRQIEEYGERERKVGLRLETKMEHAQKLEEEKQKAKEDNRRLKETLSHSKQVYEKEIRRARKEAFKASSDNIRLHEELKTERDQASLVKDEFDSTKRKVQVLEKEAFSAQYKLVEVEEELAKLQQQMRVVEGERNALRTSLKEEEIARIAAEGRIPLPNPATPDEFSSPKKQRPVTTSTSKRKSKVLLSDPFSPERKEQQSSLEALKKQLAVEIQSRKKAEDLVDFMQLECQLKRCCCRIAEENNEERYVFDKEFEIVVASIQKQIDSGGSAGAQHKANHHPHERERHRKHKHVESARPKTPIQQQVLEDTTQAMEPLIEFSPVTGTFRMVPSPAKPHQPGNSSQSIVASPEDLVLPKDALAPPLPPVAMSESPSLLSLTETTSTTKSLQDNCQIISSQDVETDDTLPFDNLVSTPKKNFSNTRPSEADLLSFTPFQISHHAASGSELVASYTQPIHAASVATSTLSRGQRPVPLPTSYSQSYIMSTTTTTIIPLAAEPSTPNHKSIQHNPSFTAGYSPGTTKTREEALQSIERWRRGRSRSVVINGTPRRFGPVGGKTDGDEDKTTVVAGKRDCSAPVPRVGRHF